MTEALEIDPSRRIQPRTRGDLLHPGACAVCGGSDPERTYVDFGLFYDYEGGIYFCNICFDEAAVKVMGYFTREEHLQLLDQHNQLIEQAAALQTELDNVRPIVDAVRSLGSVTSNPDLSDEFSDLGDPEVTEGSAEGEPEVTEPVDEQVSSGTSGAKPRDGRKPVIK